MADGRSVPEPRSSENVPPHDLQAEMGVLGCILVSPETTHYVREQLVPEAFYHLAHQDIYDAALHEFDRHNTVDLVLVRDELERRQKLEKVGGAVYLADLHGSAPNPANVEFYVEIVKERAVRRRMLQAAQLIQHDAQDPSKDVAGLLDDAERRILAIRQQRDRNETREMDSVLHELIERLDIIHQNPDQLTGLSTGFYDLDGLTNGLQPGEMIVVAARPSAGKTSFALNVLHRVCVVERQPAVLFSLEMRAVQVVSNFLCVHTRIDSHRLRRGTLEEQEWQDLEYAISELQGIPFFIDDSAVLSVMDIRARARRLIAQHGIGLVAVDYLQLVRPARTSDNRAQEVAEVSHGLKSLARELNIPVLAVAQLRREAEDREPRMSDLKESGAIEQDADVIMLLHRPRAYEEQEDGIPGGNEADLFLVKQRNGPTGRIKLYFMAHCFRFESPARH